MSVQRYCAATAGGLQEQVGGLVLDDVSAVAYSNEAELGHVLVSDVAISYEEDVLAQ